MSSHLFEFCSSCLMNSIRLIFWIFWFLIGTFEKQLRKYAYFLGRCHAKIKWFSNIIIYSWTLEKFSITRYFYFEVLIFMIIQTHLNTTNIAVDCGWLRWVLELILTPWTHTSTTKFSDVYKEFICYKVTHTQRQQECRGEKGGW